MFLTLTSMNDTRLGTICIVIVSLAYCFVPITQGQIIVTILGPLCTWAKDRDHVIVRGLNYQPKGRTTDTVCRNLEMGLTHILANHETLCIVCHVGIHVDFSSMIIFLGVLGPSHSRMKWTSMIFAFSTQERSQHVMVTCLWSHLWSGPHCDLILLTYDSCIRFKCSLSSSPATWLRCKRKIGHGVYLNILCF